MLLISGMSIFISYHKSMLGFVSMIYNCNYLNFYPGDELISFVYLVLLLLFLLPLSILIAYQSFNIVKLELCLTQLRASTSVDPAPADLFVAVKILIHKRLWFQAITLIESKYAMPKEAIHQYYNAVGFIYDNMCQYDLAQAYYVKSISINKRYITALQNLVKLYFKKRHYSLVLSTCNLILTYDKDNKVAQRYLRNLGG